MSTHGSAVLHRRIKVDANTARAVGSVRVPTTMAGVAPLLEKLEPMAMMEEGGLQRASIAIKLLAHKSATDPSVGGGILEARGVRILLQVSSCGSGFLLFAAQSWL